MNLKERLSKLSPEQRTLLERKLKQQRKGIDILTIPITREERDDSARFPLSFAQERLWFVDQLTPGNPAYNIVRATKLEGILDIDALERSINYIISRHEILRTIFIFDHDEPRQMILPALSIPFPVIDLSDMEREKQESEVKHVKEKESLYAFDLGRGPLIRTHLLVLNPADHVFLLVIHHIISDGISTEIFLSELIRSYRFFSQGRKPDLPTLSVQYIDYACWQRRWFFGKKQEEFWLNEFRGEIPVLEVPTDYPRPVMQSFEGDIVYFRVDTGIQKALKEIASREKTTLFVLLLSLYNTFLSKISGMDDIIVGSPAAGRRHPALKDMIGMFVNTLPLRNFPREEKRFGDFLAEVSVQTLKAFENQEYRYEDIVERTEIIRDTGRNPLFDAAFLFQNQDEAKLEIPGLTFSPLPYEPKTSKFDLTFEVIHTGNELRFSIEYCTKLFREETVQRFTRYFINILSAVTANPDVRLSDIEIIDEEERHRLLSEFNRTAAAFPSGKTIHGLFQEQAKRVPDNIAINISSTSHITYAELDRKSDRLALYLRKGGIGPGSIAAIMMDRSIDMVIGIFAVLRAGGAYLPIAAEYPEDRVNFILADSAAKILLTRGRDVHFRLPVVDYRSSISVITEPLHPSLSVDLHPRLAYIIYTSGSTGKSKGVLVEHQSVVNILFSLFELYPFGAEDTYLLKTPYIFDVSVSELFGWFMGGGRLAVLEREAEKDPGKILRAVFASNVTHINFVPSMFNSFVDGLNAGNIDHLSSLKYIFLAGEALSSGVVNTFRQFNTRIRLENLYGPTEGTVYTTGYSLPDGEFAGNVPIGKPLHNVTLSIVDRYDRLQPIGVAGELCIAGEGVARGYLNRPELTHERFYISDKSQKSYVFYRTGDFARWRSDGNIEFLGRLDRQVKIRGFRVEPGEIENYLRQHEEIKEAVVIDRQDKNNEKYLCAYIVVGGSTEGRKTLSTASLRSYLAEKLPPYMLPSAFVKIGHLPLNPSGKVDVSVLRRLEGERVDTGALFTAPRTRLERNIRDAWKEILGREKIGIDDNFFDLGGTSLGFIKLSRRLKNLVGEEVPVVTLFQYPTIGSLANYLAGAKGGDSEAVSDMEPEPSVPLPGAPFDIAVIGMSLRVPGARDVDEFWNNLKNGIESISFFTADELKEAGIDDILLKNPDYVRAKGILENKDTFDCSFFDYLASEAEVMDPQMRLFHEHTWEALENAGYTPDRFGGAIGLYAGATQVFDREMWALFSETGRSMGHFEITQLIKRDFFATRISYKLNLTGPAVLVQSACSTSLLAIHTACRALIGRECDLAIAGGVTLHPGRKAGYLYQKGMISSPDGHCRSFDAEARGTVDGEGIGIVILKRLRDALADGDTVYAVVKGSAVNNDGKRKAGYTAPAVDGQTGVIRKALRAARFEPESISYVETHGTATTLGDPIEIKALTTAFNTQKRNYCAVGSIKTNVGHLDSASGVAGFIKTVLSLKHRLIPPSLHFKSSNPAIDFENSPFYVNAAAREWKNNGYPFRAGVSAFGIGGTNVHVVLEEAPEIEKSKTDGREHQLLLLSAKTETALDEMTRNLARYFKESRIEPSAEFLADAAYTLQVGRKAFPFRRRLVCAGVREAAEELGDAGTLVTQVVKDQTRPVIFLFSGLGGQYENMGFDLYCSETLFRKEMDRCFEILTSLTGYDFKESFFHLKGGHKSDRDNRSCTSSDIAQIAVFIFEYSLARLLMSWGVKPDAMIGYSFGEYAAACIAGVFSLEDALDLIVSRGELIEHTSPGVMLSVPLTAVELEPLINREKQLSLSIDNGPSCVVSGLEADIDAFEGRMKERRLMCMRLSVSRAVHSHLMEPILNEFGEKVSRVTLRPPLIPLISNVTGTWMKKDETADYRYWVRHLRNTVRFAAGVEELVKKDNAVFIEIGPGRDITTLLTRYKDEGGSLDIKTVNLVRPPQKKISDVYYLLNKVGELWLYGLTIDWKSFHAGEMRHRIPLPAYPFQRQRFPIEGNVLKMASSLLEDQAGFKKKEDIADWFYIPSWKRIGIPVEQTQTRDASRERCWLIFTGKDTGGFENQLAEQLEKNSKTVVVVKTGPGFEHIDDRHFTVNPRKESDYNDLFNQLRRLDNFPDRILYFWMTDNGSSREKAGLDMRRFEEARDFGFYSLLNIARAIGNQGGKEDIHLTTVTDNMQEVIGGDGLWPEKAVILGPVKIISTEYPNIRCRSIDIARAQPGTADEKQLVRRLISEFRNVCNDPVVAYRGSYRWVQVFEPQPVGKTGEKNTLLRPEGVYLVTGGLGGVGLILAKFLAEKVRAKLVLTGRSQFPPREQWNDWKDTENGPGAKIRKLKELENSGAEVLVCSADTADLEQMQRVFIRTEEQFGPINGVIHCAGLPDGEMIQRRTADASERVFTSKITGTLVLDHLLKERQQDLDFFVLCSSLNAVLPVFGQVAYCAANAFLDAFAHYRNRANLLSLELTMPPATISINWDRWQNVGLAVITEEKLKKLTGKELEGGIECREGMEVFDRILTGSSPRPQVIVSTGDLDLLHRRAYAFDAYSLVEESEKMTAPKTMLQRPELSVKYAAPENNDQERLVRIWENFFAFRPIGIDDDFVELGGDSLKAITLIARMQKELDVRVSLPDFFNLLTIRGLAEHIRKTGEKTYTGIEPAEEEEYYPLSSSQKRMYILNLFTEYTIPLFLEVEGSLERDRVEGAFQELIKRHDSLRTSFHTLNGETVQKIRKQVDFTVEYDNLAVENMEIPADFMRPFDLSQAPLLRVKLIKLTGERHFLLLNVHHIIADGFSLRIMGMEFSCLYRQQELPRVNVGYRDFSRWHNRLLQSGVYRSQEAYWSEVFSGELPVLNMALDYPRPAMQSFEGRIFTFYVEREEFRSLKKLSRIEGTSLYMVLLAVCNTLLFRYTGQEDIVIGTISAGREHRDVENMVGIFINPLALRNFPSETKTFRDFLTELKQRNLEAHENQLYPFGDLLEKVVKKKDHSRSPLFDVMLTFQNRDAGSLEVEGLQFSPYEPEPLSGHQPSGHAQQDITLWGTEEETRIRIDLEYCAALFKPGTMDRFADHFITLLRGATADPGLKLSEIEMITGDEKRRILTEFNHEETPVRGGKTLHRLFEERVKQTPDHIALIANAKTVPRVSVTYRELNEKAERWAQVLRKRGVASGSIIGLLLESSIEMILGILSILKAGGAYLPLDTSYPAARITYMLGDSRARLLLTQEEFKKTVPFGGSVVFINGNAPPEIGPSDSGMVYPGHPSDPAYIIYTSGSTGKPKGVIVEHRNVTAYLQAFYREFEIKPADTVIQLAPYCFDVFVEEVYPVLLKGGKLFIPTPAEKKKIDLLVRLIFRYNVTIVDCTPLLLNEFNKCGLVGEGDGPAVPVHTFISGGDVLKGSYVDNLKKNAAVYNTYGPTESTVCAAYYNYSDSEGNRPGNGAANIPIGNPIFNYQVHILDKNRELVPIGVPGELCVSGAGVTRGYLNNPELTAEKFFNNQSYKTGDLARWLADGNIEFLGRIDDQVKIRGFRIEIKEIEKQLTAHHNIKEAVVLDKEDNNGSKYLCGYIVPGDETGTRTEAFGASFTVSGLREYLAGELPDYMIPSQFIEIEKIPLTPNGKIDRKALDALEGGIDTGTEYVPPSDEIERKLADIWSGILMKDRIGVNDNFFDLGGQSILGMRVVSKVNEIFHVDIPLISFFQVGTIRGIAGLISGSSPGDVHPADVTGKGLLRPFDLSRAPLLRAALIRFRQERHLLFIDMHHIISDGMSGELFAHEFTGAYEGRELPALPIQYKDFARWQADFMAGEVYLKQEAFWLDCFSDYVPHPELPLDFSRSDARRRESRTVKVDLGTDLAGRVKTFVAFHEVTLYMFFLAVYTIVLARYAGREEIIVGTPAAGRTHADLDPLIGMFVNTLALRNFPGKHVTFRQYLEDVKTRTLLALENQDYQFDMLVEKMNLSGDTGRNPLFDSFFVVEDDYEPDATGGIGELTVNPVETGYSRAMFDLTFRAVIAPGGINVYFNYDIDLFKETTVQKIADQTVDLLKWVLHAPDGPINSALPFHITEVVEEKDLQKEFEAGGVMTEAQRGRILYEFNDTKTDYPDGKTIYGLFEEQAEQIPDNIALQASNGSHLTYSELNNESRRLAVYLIERGVCPGTIAAVMTERSINMVVGIFAVLKAGGAYLPIEPAYPGDRINYILADSGAKVLLTHRSWGEKISAAKEVIFFEDNGLRLSASPDLYTEFCAACPEDMAYIIYTSGSTGHPKGVMADQKGVVNLLFELARRYPFGESNRNLLKTSCMFDVSVSELFGWFSGRGRSVILEIGGEKDPGIILDTVERERINQVNFVPTMFTFFVGTLNESNAGKLSPLEYIFLGGEPVVPGTVNTFRRFNRTAKIENLYGPTEATVYTSIYSLSGWDGSGCIPIGRPISNVTISILDKSGHLQPVGTAGELVISGDGVGRGYLNRPELTAERFNRSDRSEISYFTGDLARWLPDGSIEYLGRIDTQVKIRGFRIELGEIEFVLLKYPGIREAAVADRSDPGGIKYLSAYIAGDGDFTVEALREHLLKELPDYMVPAVFSRVDKLPLTTSGKLDRKALPQQNSSVIKPGRAYTAPRNELERKLAETWCRVLKADRIGIDDNFFHLGGDSLKANLLAARIKKEFGKEIALNQIFKALTVREMSRIVSLPGEPGYKPVVPVEKREYYHASPVQKRQYVLNRLSTDDVTYNMPTALLLEGDIDREKLGNAFNTIIRRHESLRTDFHMEGGDVVQRVHDHVDFQVPYYQPDRDGADDNPRYIAEIIKGEVSLRPLQGVYRRPDQMEAVEKKEYYRLSSAQKRMYILQQLDLDSNAYNVSKLIPVDKKIDKDRVEKTFMEIVRRHESFRTSFVVVDDEPVQRIHDHAEVPIRYFDSIPGGAEGVTAFARNFVRPFDLSTVPLLRICIIRLEEEKYVLLLDMHHIVMDELSNEILTGEFNAIYGGEDLPPLRIQYKDYAEWQNSEIERASLKKQEEYWLREFEGEIPLLNLPTDYERPDILGFQGSLVSFAVEPGLTVKIKKHASQMGVTLMMYLLTAYKILLWKYTGQEDVVVGTVITGRNRKELEGIIGFFVNMLAVRTTPGQSKTVGGYLMEVKEKAANAYENQGFQFEELVGKLKIPRHPGRHPLVDTVFVLQDASRTNQVAAEGSGFDLFDVSHFDLLFHVTAVADSLRMIFEYSTDLFKKSTIEGFADAYIEILEQIVDNRDLDLRLSEIQIQLNLLTVTSDIFKEDTDDWDI